MTGEQQYLDLLTKLLDEGVYREGRNGGTYGLFGAQMRFNLRDGFPLLTTKKLFTRGIVAELLWFLSGSTNIKPLQEQGVHIWDEWADANGDLGPVYGKQWRSWACEKPVFRGGMFSHFEPTTIDQIYNVVQGLINDPNGRRHIVTAWNPAEIEDMALPPCHCLFQFFVANGRLSCQLYQRSADFFLGVPFNIASYALLTHIIAQEVGLEVGEFVHTFGDYHLYANHVEQARRQVARAPLTFPRVRIAEKAMCDLVTADIEFLDYRAHPAIKAEVSV